MLGDPVNTGRTTPAYCPDRKTTPFTIRNFIDSWCRAPSAPQARFLVVVVKLVFPLSPRVFGALLLITLLGRLHREPVRALRLDGGQRDLTFERRTATLRTLGHRVLPHQSLECMLAISADVFVDRHGIRVLLVGGRWPVARLIHQRLDRVLNPRRHQGVAAIVRVNRV